MLLSSKHCDAALQHCKHEPNCFLGTFKTTIDLQPKTFEFPQLERESAAPQSIEYLSDGELLSTGEWPESPQPFIRQLPPEEEVPDESVVRNIALPTATLPCSKTTDCLKDFFASTVDS